MSRSHGLMVSMLACALLASAACSGDSKKTGTGGSGGDGGDGGNGGSGGSGGSGGKAGSGGSGGSGGTGGSAGTGGTGGSAGTGGTAGAGVDAAATMADAGSPDLGSAGDLAPGVSPMMSFFITSRTGDGNLGGLEGADKICQTLAGNVGLGHKTWRAYLSTNMPKVDAKSRIGTGPWHNVKGVKIADNVDGLHTTAGGTGATPGNMIDGTTGLDEKGGTIPTANPQQHDIITGTNMDGTAAAGQTCMDWTGQGTGRVGHHNRMGGNAMTGNSWNAAHDNAGCTAATITMRGGAGRFYCFATN